MLSFFDAHFQIVDKKFPLIENQGFIPESFSLEKYFDQIQSYDLKILGGAIVSGSFQGNDQAYLTEALSKLPNSFVGVTQLPLDTRDETILKLHVQGIRAVRFNLYRNAEKNYSEMVAFAKRVYKLVGWHTEIYLDGSRLSEYFPFLRELPIAVIDHLGLKPAKNLLELVSAGIYLKATGFGRITFDPLPVINEIVRENSNHLLFGTDLPGTRARRPFLPEDILLIVDNFSETIAHKILYQNAQKLYLKEKNFQTK